MVIYALLWFLAALFLALAGNPASAFLLIIVGCVHLAFDGNERR